MQKNRNSGFTLVEVVIASFVLVIAMGMMYNTYLSGSKVWENARESADLQAEARWAMNYMVAELRNATRTSTNNPSPNLSIPSHPNNKSIIFYLPQDKDNDGLITDSSGAIEWGTNNAIHYQHVPGQNLLRRLEKGVQTSLSQDVSDVQFIDASIDSSLSIYELRIILALNKTTKRQRNLSITLSAIVRLRN
jgi:prepilin-type N-terminal cleavage/methylation domain-containing protein